MTATVQQPRLYVAIDTPEFDKAKKRIESVNDVEGDFGFKINSDLVFLNGGVEVVADFVDHYGRSFFVDMKMWNGGRTMAELAVGLAKAGATLTNMYAQSGVKYMRRVKQAVAESGYPMDVFGLGVLTHYTDTDCFRLYGKSLADSVRMFAEDVALAELDGYIQPGNCLDMTSGIKPKRLVPGIRPLWYPDAESNDQNQDVTPEEAFGGGADIIVAGSAVFKSPVAPAEAVRLLLAAA